MSNNKQSSVEYLMDKLFDPSSMVEEQLEWFEKAKALHKKEIIEAYKWGRYDSDKLVMSERFYREQYYNETFGGNK